MGHGSDHQGAQNCIEQDIGQCKNHKVTCSSMNIKERSRISKKYQERGLLETGIITEVFTEGAEVARRLDWI